MKYVISWRERPAASSRDFEAAHERILEIFSEKWKMPASFSMLQFVVRIGDYGGYMIVETDKPTDIHYVTSFFAVFEFKAEPVVDVMDAVAVEVKADDVVGIAVAGPPIGEARAAGMASELISYAGPGLKRFGDSSAGQRQIV